jgi:hypothetical protein
MRGLRVLLAWVLVADAWFANALLQLVSDYLAFCLGRGQPINESLDVTGKVIVTVFRGETGNGAPTVLDLAPCFHKRAFTGFDAGIAL